MDLRRWTLRHRCSRHLLSWRSHEASHRVTSSNALTLEAWVTPDVEFAPGILPKRIVTMSDSPTSRNFTLGQGITGAENAFDARLRTTTNNTNGNAPSLSGGAVTVGTPQHVVYTRDAAGNATLYVNNSVVATATIGGNLSGWDASYPLTIPARSVPDHPDVSSWVTTASSGSTTSRSARARSPRTSTRGVRPIRTRRHLSASTPAKASMPPRTRLMHSRSRTPARSRSSRSASTSPPASSPTSIGIRPARPATQRPCV